MPGFQVIRVMRKVIKMMEITYIITFVFQHLSEIQNLNQEGKEERV